jgi:histone deacetylase complex regulatory component SIN3
LILNITYIGMPSRPSEDVNFLNPTRSDKIKTSAC